VKHKTLCFVLISPGSFPYISIMHLHDLSQKVFLVSMPGAMEIFILIVVVVLVLGPGYAIFRAYKKK